VTRLSLVLAGESAGEKNVRRHGLCEASRALHLGSYLVPFLLLRCTLIKITFEPVNTVHYSLGTSFVKMSRRQPSDTFTRFTSNSIHASQKPPSQGPPIAPARPAETPQEKVARLRAQMRAQREGGAQLSFGDKVVAGGRKWADILHRGFTYTLFGVTAVTGVFAGYGLVSLIVHARRQKRAFIESELDRLAEAQKAFLRGEANAEQLHLLEQERAGEEMSEKWKKDRAEQKTRGLWQRVKAVFGGSDRDMGTETPADVQRREHWQGGSRILEEAWVEPTHKKSAVAESHIKGVGYDEKGRPIPVNKIEKIVRTAESERRSGEKVLEPAMGRKGGMLDELADNAAAAASTKTSGSSWFGWLGGKS
jgi:hypothetical protein